MAPLQVALRGVDGQGSRGDVFLGAPELFTAKDTITLPISVASGNWLMAARYPQLENLATGVWFHCWNSAPCA